MFLDAILQVAQNMSTITIPATIVPTFSQTAPTVAAGTDPLGVMGIISMALAAYNTYQTKKNDVKQSSRANSLADTQIDMVDSQKKTDQGVKELAMGVNMTVNKLANNPNNKEFLETALPELGGKSIKEYMQAEKEAWEKDFKAYYQDTSPKPGEFSKDPVIAKTEVVKKLATPS